jgi:hypothetical protein
MISNPGSRKAAVTLLATRSLDPEPPAEEFPPSESTMPRSPLPRDSADLPPLDEALSLSMNPPASLSSRREYLEQMTATMAAIGMMLAARFLLLMATLSAALLTYLAINQATVVPLIAAASFDVLVVMPLVALYWQRG